MLKTLEKTRAKPKAIPLRWDITVITPEIAAQWLEQNKKNRKISARVVATYARDMQAGAWRLTGDPIRFDINGHLIDGQHRLAACVKAGVNFTTAVLYGLQPSDQDVIDTLRPRTAGDALALHGHHGTSLLAAMCRAIAYLKAGTAHNQVKLSTTEVLRMVEARPGLQVSVGRVWALPRGIPRAGLGLVHFIASTALDNKTGADAFVDVFRSGIPAYEGCAAHTLRERFMVHSYERSRVDRAKVLNAYMHAWNYFSESEPVENFRVPKDPHMNGLKWDDI